MAREKPIIVGLGEALYDVLPDRESLGGAPLNVAVHAHQLGNEGIVVSRVGDDERGRQMMRHLRSRKMRADYLQIDEQRATGTVDVILNDGEPSYEIVPGVAWDAMHFDRRLGKVAARCDAVCFGTLGQRTPDSRRTIRRFIEHSVLAVRMFDVNLRQDFYNRSLIEASLDLATAAKLNADEIQVVRQTLELGSSDAESTSDALRDRFALDFVAVTRGPEGVIVYTDDGAIEAESVHADVAAGDRVGAGDSASAAILHGRVRGWPWERTIELANAIGAWVASESGACPPLNDSIKQMLVE